MITFKKVFYFNNYESLQHSTSYIHNKIGLLDQMSGVYLKQNSQKDLKVTIYIDVNVFPRLHLNHNAHVAQVF